MMCWHMVYAAGDVHILCITHLSLTVTAHDMYEEAATEMLVEFSLRVHVWIVLCIVVYTFCKYLYALTGYVCVCVCVYVCVCIYICMCTHSTHINTATHTATSTNSHITHSHINTHIKWSTNQTPHTHQVINKPDTTHTSSGQQTRHHTHIKRSTNQTPHTHQAINKPDTTHTSSDQQTRHHTHIKHTASAAGDPASTRSTLTKGVADWAVEGAGLDATSIGVSPDPCFSRISAWILYSSVSISFITMVWSVCKPASHTQPGSAWRQGQHKGVRSAQKQHSLSLSLESQRLSRIMSLSSKSMV